MFDKMFAATAAKVHNHTPEYVDEEIQRRIEANINTFRERDAFDIKKRLEELNLEWDIERVLETNLAAIILLSSFFGITKSRAWMLLSGTASVFMLQHALQGWCPPLTYLRKMGIRTAEEINQEKTALKKLLS